MKSICLLSRLTGKSPSRFKWVIAAVIVILFLLPSVAYAAVPLGSLVVTSDPPGARVYLDGVYKGTTTYAYKFDPGHYVLKLTYPGYQSYETTIALISNEVTSIDVELVKIPTTGTLTVSSTPSGAKVYIDGSYKGNTPYSDTLSPGTYDIKVTMTGYNDHETTATIVAGEETMLSFWMYPLETSGILSVSSSPWGAFVYVDGIYTGITPLTEAAEAGIHTVTISMAGYNDHISSVSVPAGGTASVSAVLTKITGTVTSTVSTTITSTPSSATGTGTYIILSTPEGARVYLDGSVIGVTPLRAGDLSPGQHALILEMSGYHDYATVINVVAGADGMVDLDLAPVEGETPAPTYTMPGFGWIIALGAVITVVAAIEGIKK